MEKPPLIISGTQVNWFVPPTPNCPFEFDPHPRQFITQFYFLTVYLKNPLWQFEKIIVIIEFEKNIHQKCIWNRLMTGL